MNKAKRQQLTKENLEFSKGSKRTNKDEGFPRYMHPSEKKFIRTRLARGAEMNVTKEEN